MGATATLPRELTPHGHAGIPFAARQDLHHLSISLARQPSIVAFAWDLVAAVPAADRLARIALLFSFVSHLVDVPAAGCDDRDGVDSLMRLAGSREGPAVILSALLRAVGEHAVVDAASDLVFVRVAISLDDLARLPPHAGPVVIRGRYFLPLDPREARSPLGFLPRPARTALARALAHRALAAC